MNHNYTLWVRIKPWVSFAFWITVDFAMVIWGGQKTQWGKKFWQGMFND